MDKLIQLHCRLDLTAPMPGCSVRQKRHLLFEGDLKLREGTASKVRREIDVLKITLVSSIVWALESEAFITD